MSPPSPDTTSLGPPRASSSLSMRTPRSTPPTPSPGPASPSPPPPPSLASPVTIWGTKPFNSISEIPLPHYSRKPIATLLLDIIILIDEYTLTSAKLNTNDNSNSCSTSWTKLDSHLKYLEDNIFLEGRIRAVDCNGTLAG